MLDVFVCLSVSVFMITPKVINRFFSWVGLQQRKN